MACTCMRHWSYNTTIRSPVVASAGNVNSKVLVLGGTGRVGGSTALALSKLKPDLRIVIAGRNREKGANMVTTLGNNAEFAEVDINDDKSLDSALTDVDLVVHAAGPFQQTENCRVLEAAIRAKTAYLDVCDDTSYALRAKSFKDEALAANVPAITTGGIYPGVSNVMAAELVRVAKEENKGEPERLRFYYYTAGTGGAGPTILATSFLLLGEEVTAYNKGEKIKLRPYSSMVNIDFGRGIGKKDVYLLNLPEVTSTHEVLGVPTVSARFGTAPFFWNWAMDAMTRFVPSEVLRDRSKVQEMVRLFDPVVRVIDGYAGERVSIRVDVECSGGRETIGVFTHKRLSVQAIFSLTSCRKIDVLDQLVIQQLRLLLLFLRAAHNQAYGFQKSLKESPLKLGNFFLNVLRKEQLTSPCTRLHGWWKRIRRRSGLEYMCDI